MKLSTGILSLFVTNAFAAFLAMETVSGQIVINGSFESGIYPIPGTDTELHAVDATSIDGWIVKNGTIDYVGSTRWETGNGFRCIDLTGSSRGTISQTIDGFTIGQDYRVSFLMAGNPEGEPTIKSLQASIGTFSEVFTFDGAGFSAVSMGWSKRTFDFTASAPQMTLSFASLNDWLYGPAIDAVALSVVPEPAGTASMAGCFTALVLLKRVRTRR